MYCIDPLQDSRWDALVRSHSRSTIFHTAAWAGALTKTYGYPAMAITTNAPGQALRNGLIFCRVDSWLTGRRMISMPFSDHCGPLAANEEESGVLVSAFEESIRKSGCRYGEIRAPFPADGRLAQSGNSGESFAFHELDLTGKLDEIFRSFHKDCVQRKIRRADREALVYDSGRSEDLLRGFYGLLIQTRRRHRIPPQPVTWFRNLLAACGDNASIHAAYKGSRPAAAILTLKHKDTMVYKYGASDRSLSSLGGMQFLFWKAIQAAKEEGLVRLDLGRSDWDNPGLIEFKNRLGAAQSTISYWRRPPGLTSTQPNWKTQMARRIFAHLPDGMLAASGRFLYRHIG